MNDGRRQFIPLQIGADREGADICINHKVMLESPHVVRHIARFITIVLFG